MKVGVVIARFQLPSLHTGHTALLEHVDTVSDRLVVLLGVAPFRSKQNPLPFEYREWMVRKFCPSAQVFPIFDCESYTAWDNAVDSFLKQMYPGAEITLWHSRDSFKDSYKGKLPTIEFKNTDASATERRMQIAQEPFQLDPVYARGFVKGVMTEWPKPQMAVDIAALKALPSGKPTILLGKRDHEDYWRLPGGMVDPTDVSLEFAACRELFEETGLTSECVPRYVGSFNIPDWRVRGTSNALISALFLVESTIGYAKGNDDIDRAEWKDLSLAVVGELHKPLLEAVRTYVKSNFTNGLLQS